MSTTQFVYLSDLLPGLEIDFEHYWLSEEEIITPALREIGYWPQRPWYTGERDSFGPLSRCLHTNKGVVVYG